MVPVSVKWQDLLRETDDTGADRLSPEVGSNRQQCKKTLYSFGFSAWTMEGTEKYCKERVIPCRIEYQDVARVVHSDGSNIRCRKLTVLA